MTTRLLLAYAHPLAAGAVVALVGYAGSRGLQARSDPRRAAEHLRRHTRSAPVMYWLVLVSWCTGTLSTWWLRYDLQVAASMHFRIGLALVVALSGSTLTAYWIRHPLIRALHPWFGAAAMLLAAAQVFFGLQITP